jgi:hypothetical protein
MKIWSKMLSVVAVVMMAGVLNAADAPKADAPKPEKAKKASIKGDVVKVDGANVVISTGKKDAKKEVTVVTDANTVVTIEGKPAKVADLKAGQKISISPETGTAAKIEVAAPKAKKAEKAAAK